MYSYDRRPPQNKVAAGNPDAEKILALFKKHFKGVHVEGGGSSRDVYFEFYLENGLFKPGLVVPFAEAFGVDPSKVTLSR